MRFSSIGYSALWTYAGTAMLAGCGGAQSPIAVPAAISQTAGVRPAAKTSCETSPCIYVTDAGGERITVYSATANGNVKPDKTITGSNTGLSWPYGIGLDANGNVYAANYFGDAITVYAAGSNGNVSPLRTISGSNTGLFYPSGLALDTGGRVYAKNGYYESVLIITAYNQRRNGNAAPNREIAGEEPAGATPFGIAVDGSGNLYVARPRCANDRSDCLGNDKVFVYGPKANGHARPIWTISGSRTGLNIPSSVAVDNAGNVYVTNSNNYESPNTVTVYAAGSHGNVAPIQTISGAKTQLNEPDAIAVDAEHNMYVANYTGTVLVYAAGASGNVSPLHIIAGSRTGLSGPEGIAVH